MSKTTRALEDVGFGLALFFGLFYTIAEGLIRLGFVKTPGARPLSLAFFVIICLVFALPKLLGRATAGRIWEIIAARWSGGRIE